MPFIESSQSVQAKAHVSEVKPAVLIGILALACVCVVLFGGNVLSVVSGASFSLESDTDKEAQSDYSVACENAVDNRNIVCSSSASTLHSSSVEQTGAQNTMVYVFVSGQVAKPGVYSLREGSRVNDAIEAAGGFTEDAHRCFNNLARLVLDGEQIHVPSHEELQGNTNTLQAGQTQLFSESALLQPDQQALININVASQEELESLPGIGAATAQKIIMSREEDGPFSSPDELMRVSGIGEKKYDALKDLICV